MNLKYFLNILFLCPIILWAQPKTIDKIAAQVGDNVILLSDIQGQKLQMLQAGLTLNEGVDCQILEELMYQKLLLNQAILDSIEVSDEQVNAEMENRIRVIENQIGGKDKLEAFYGKTIAQIKSEFKDAIKEQLLAQEMERQITGEISVTPREVEKFFNSLDKDSIPFINAQLSFQQIVFYPEITAADKKKAFDRLAEIRKDIVENGKSFSTMARIHSEDPGSAADGGKIEASRGMMVAPFEAAAFNLNIGEVSQIFETTYGYHILKLLDRKGDDYTCQHILIIPQFDDQALERAAMKIDTCYSLLMSGKITWNDAVLKYSNDEDTKQNNGIITNPITGEQTWDMEDLNQVDQQIYLITDVMEPGDISQPALYTNLFSRKQGIRIVRLLSRTSPHKANLKDDYNLIKMAAENQKKQEMIAEWTSQKIQNAYIRIDENYQSCSFVNPWNRP
jgi:peptidyl-prolyl cis-trans isomerase SurA